MIGLPKQKKQREAWQDLARQTLILCPGHWSVFAMRPPDSTVAKDTSFNKGLKKNEA